VHEFSRLNSKGLLDSTIDAVGETRLKEKHGELKELQKELLEGEEMAGRKEEILEQKKVRSSTFLIKRRFFSLGLCIG
jgi:hypothetical protein